MIIMMMMIWSFKLSDFILLKDRQSTYYVTMRPVRVTIVAVEKQ